MSKDEFCQFKDELKIHIEDVIQQKVNGKIDVMNRRFDEYIKLDNDWKAKDMEWKITHEKYHAENLEPMVASRKNFQWLGSTMKTVMSFLALVLGVIVSFLVARDKLK